MSLLEGWLNTKLQCFEDSEHQGLVGQRTSKECFPNCELTYEQSPGINGIPDVKTAAKLIRADNGFKNVYTDDAAKSSDLLGTPNKKTPRDQRSLASRRMSGVGGDATRQHQVDVSRVLGSNSRQNMSSWECCASDSKYLDAPAAPKLLSGLTKVHSTDSCPCTHRTWSHGCGTVQCNEDPILAFTRKGNGRQTGSRDVGDDSQLFLDLFQLPFAISPTDTTFTLEASMPSLSKTDRLCGRHTNPPIHFSRACESSLVRNALSAFPTVSELTSTSASPTPTLIPTPGVSAIPLSHSSTFPESSTIFSQPPGFCFLPSATPKSLKMEFRTGGLASLSMTSDSVDVRASSPIPSPSCVQDPQRSSRPQAGKITVHSRTSTVDAKVINVQKRARSPQTPPLLCPHQQQHALKILPPYSGPSRGSPQQLSDFHPTNWLRGLKKDSCIWSLRHPDILLSASRLQFPSRSQQHRDRRKHHRIQRQRLWPYPDQQQTTTSPRSQLHRRHDDEDGGWSTYVYRRGCRSGSSCPSSAGSSRMSSSPPSSSMNNDGESSVNDEELCHFDGYRMAPAQNNSFDFYMAENIYNDVPSDTEETNFDSLLDQCKIPPYQDTEQQQCMSDTGAVCDVGEGFDLMCDISSSHLTLEEDVEPSVASSVSARCDVSLGPSSTFVNVSHRSPSPLSAVSQAATAGTHFDSNWPSVSDDDGDSCSTQKEVNSTVGQNTESAVEIPGRRQPLPDYQTMTPWTNDSLRQASSIFPLPSHEIPCFMLNPNVLEGQEGTKSPKASPPRHSPSVNRSSTAVTTTVNSPTLRQPSLVSRMYASKASFPSLAAQRLSREKRFRKTAEALQKCGLWDIAMKTGNLVKRNSELQKEIDAFRSEAMAFLKSVIRNPENKDLRLSSASTYSLPTTQNWSVKGTDSGQSDMSTTVGGNNKISSSCSSTTSGYTTCHTGSSIRQSSPSLK